MPRHIIVGLSDGPEDPYMAATEHALAQWRNGRGGFGLDGTYYELPGDGMGGFFGDVGDFFTRILKPVTQILPPQLRVIQPFKKPLDAAIKLTLAPFGVLTAQPAMTFAKRNPALAQAAVGVGVGIATGNPALGAAAAAGVGAATNPRQPGPPPMETQPVVIQAVGGEMGPGEIQGPPMTPVGASVAPYPNQAAGPSALPNWGPPPPPVVARRENAYESRQIVTPADAGRRAPRPAPRAPASAIPAWAPWAAGAVALALVLNRRPR